MKHVVIDSKKRLNGTSTEFSYNISQEVKIQKKIRLAYSSIPNTSYMINSKNNVFKIKFASDGAHVTYNLAVGTYMPQELGDLVTAAVNRLSFAMTYNNNTLKYTMAASENFNIDWSVSGNLNQILGYDLSQVNGTPLTGLNIIKFVYPEVLYIKISDLSGSVITSDPLNYNFVVPIFASFGVLNFYNDDSVFDGEISQQYNQMTLKTHFKVTISDEYGQVYDNNNVDTMLILQCE